MPFHNMCIGVENMTQSEHSTQAERSDQTLIEKLKNLEEGDRIEVNVVDETLTVLSTRVIPYGDGLHEIHLEDSDGREYDLRQFHLNPDDVHIEPRAVFSDPRLVRELEVIQ